MKKFDLSLYLILDPDLCGGFDGVVNTAHIAIENGVTFLQLRAPNWKKREMVECAKNILSFSRKANIPLVIDDHVDVALASQADGVHIGQKDLLPIDARKMLGEKAIIGLSVGNILQCKTLDPSIVDYAGVGPVYPTSTKADASEAIGIDGLKTVLSNLQVPVVAIGGIKPNNASECIKAGADGISVISAICGQADIAKATQLLKNAINI